MIAYRNIILRDFIESDIEKRVYWETTETEWQLWDSPWEYDGLTAAEKERDLNKYRAAMHSWAEKYKNLPDSKQRSSFQIVTNDRFKKYIGWVNSYRIDETYNFTKDHGYCTVGIDIPDLTVRGKGYSYQALYVFIKYLLRHSEKSVYTQTWSGNERMLHVAEKIGFEECGRNTGVRLVRGKTYDGLTLKLNMEKFEVFSGKMKEQEF